MTRRRALLSNTDNAPTPTGIYGQDYEWTIGYYLGDVSSSTGVPIASSYYKVTLDFIPCSFLAGKTVKMTNGPDWQPFAGCCFYSAADETTYINGSAFNKDTVVVPGNAQYCRLVSNRAKDVSTISVEIVTT